LPLALEIVNTLLEAKITHRCSFFQTAGILVAKHPGLTVE
jgi:hypothetical protein